MATHERIGTHLTVNLLIKNSAAELSWKGVGERYGPFDHRPLPFDGIERFNQLSQGPGVIAKSHGDRNLCAKAYKPVPVIYVMRGPRDVRVSWWQVLNDDDQQFIRQAVRTGWPEMGCSGCDRAVGATLLLSASAGRIRPLD